LSGVSLKIAPVFGIFLGSKSGLGIFCFSPRKNSSGT